MPDSFRFPPSLQSLAKAWRFPLLFAFLVSVLLVTPLLLEYRLLYVALSLLFLNGLYVSLLAAGFAPPWRRFLAAVWVLDTALLYGAHAAADPGTELWLFALSRAAALLLLAACVTGTLRYVLRSPRVTADTIFAAIVAYQLAALAFAALYHVIAVFAPQSFAFSQGAPAGGREDAMVQLIYFSFVTIATLGYGDIVPVTPLTQMIASVEATLGQFYIAVVIAWLVSVYAAERRNRNP